MSQITHGMQLGGQVDNQMIFHDERAFDDATSGNSEFGAQATAVTLTASAQASTSRGGGGNTSSGKDTDSSKAIADNKQHDNRSGMEPFTLAKGGFVSEATPGGQEFIHEPLSGGFFCGAIPP